MKKNQNKANKKNDGYKFNLKAWLIASIFSIISAALGVANLVIHFVDK